MIYQLLFTTLTVWTFCTDITLAQTEGDVRLTGRGSNSSQGRVEIYHNNTWGTVCNDLFGSEDASIVCRQLGLSPDFAKVIQNTFGNGNDPIWLDDVQCSGTEARLVECRHNGWGNANCEHTEDVAVRCEVSAGAPSVPAIPTTTKSPNVVQDSNCTVPDTNIRIIGPSNLPGTGVVQVFTNNEWVGVCDDDWDLNDAIVVCRSLCFDANKALPGSVPFDSSNITQTMKIKSMNCLGNETSIAECPQTTGGCRPSEKAKVTCEEIDNSAPSRPDPILGCTSGRISASFSTITDPYLEPKHLSVNMTYTGPCDVRITNTTDSDFITISVPFDECGTNATTNGTHIIYRTQIRYLPTSSSGSISHSNTYIFKIQCEIPRTVDSGQPVVPITETITKKAPGRFIVNLRFFRDNKFQVPVTQFPLEVPLGEWLQSAVELQDVDSNLELVVLSCFATPTNDRNGTPKYPLFTNKCVNDQTVTYFSINNTFWGFRYQTFKFVRFDQVHIHCDAIVCRKEERDTDPDCDRSCIQTTSTSTTTAANTPSGGRRRRSATHEIIELSSPTMYVYDPSLPDSEITRGENVTKQPGPINSSVSSRVITSAEANAPTSKSNIHKISTSASVTQAEVKQTLHPPYLAEIETVITGDGSGVGAIPSHTYIMCLVIVGYLCI